MSSTAENIAQAKILLNEAETFVGDQAADGYDSYLDLLWLLDGGYVTKAEIELDEIRHSILEAKYSDKNPK